MVKIKKHYIRFYFHHDNHGEEPADIYGENTKYIIYIIFSPYTVNMVCTIHGENKRNPHFSFFPIHRRHLLLLNMVQGDALLVLIDL